MEPWQTVRRFLSLRWTLRQVQPCFPSPIAAGPKWRSASPATVWSVSSFTTNKVCPRRPKRLSRWAAWAWSCPKSKPLPLALSVMPSAGAMPPLGHPPPPPFRRNTSVWPGPTAPLSASAPAMACKWGATTFSTPKAKSRSLMGSPPLGSTTVWCSSSALRSGSIRPKTPSAPSRLPGSTACPRPRARSQTRNPPNPRIPARTSPPALARAPRAICP